MKPSPIRFLSRAVTLVALVSATSVGLYAQRATSTSQQDSALTASGHRVVNFADAAKLRSSGADETTSTETYLSSSLAANPGPQPPPRRYGRRPVYADSSHNADGSNKYTFFGGAGFTLPTGGTHAYFSPSYNFQVGGGRNFNKQLAVLAEFDWANFGLQKRATLPLESSTIYGVTVNGHAHDWSLSLDPMFTFAQSEKLGAYVIGGVGFYHKTTSLTTPSTGQYCDPYYGVCYSYAANADLAYGKYVSNAVGVNGGVGMTYKPSRFGNERFYAEARYVYTANQPKPYYDGTTGPPPLSNPNYINVFPQNSAKTTYIPVTIGIRF